MTDKTIADYLSRLGYKRERIAELVEDESGAGDRPSNKDQGTDNFPGRKLSPFGLILTFHANSAVRALSDQQSDNLQIGS